MSKRIVLCTDGSWDNASKNTNVCRLYNALASSADQVRFYDSGVGADGLPIEMFVGGAFGLGLFQKVKEGYTQIAHVYEDGDDLFLFGFSRGAYTARSIAGMIAACGLPTRNFDDALVETAFEAYRDKDERAGLLAGLNPKYGMVEAIMKMVGVWETVGALGIPAVFGGVDPVLYGFLDTSLNPRVSNAFHALSIDERRSEFPPTLWTSQPGAGQTVEQVWFRGVHSDVGGGEPMDSKETSTLADIPFAWMLDKACALGLEIDASIRTKYGLPLDPKYALDTLHSSWSPLWGFPRTRSIPVDASLADSVVVRCQHHDGWWPRNLKVVNGVPAASYNVVRVVGEPAVAAQAAMPATGGGGG